MPSKQCNNGRVFCIHMLARYVVCCYYYALNDWAWRSRPYMFDGITETKRSQLQCRPWVASLYHCLMQLPLNKTIYSHVYYIMNYCTLLFDTRI
jgi:hypothetical protein